MSRLGYITEKFRKADQDGEQPDLNEADLRWAVQWERWDLIAQAGYDVDEARAEYGSGEAVPSSDDPFNTRGVPRVGSDREMRIRRGRVETVDDSNGPNDPNEPDEEPYELDPYEKWKVDDLKAELRVRQLPADGNKDALVKRLEEDDATRLEE